MSPLRQLQHLLIVIPADEKTHSLDTDDAMIGKKSLANDAQTGNLWELIYNIIN